MAWAASFVGLAAVSAIFGRRSLSEGLWLAEILGLVSVPLIVLAIGAAFTFPDQIIRRPLLWAGLAICVATGIGVLVAHRGGLLALVIALPAAALFVASLRIWPMAQPE